MDPLAQKSAATINGEVRTLDLPAPLTTVLASWGLDVVEVRGVAVALNDEVVRRADWPSTIIRPGDRIEVVSASQGG